jgi:hypothetical protein
MKKTSSQIADTVLEKCAVTLEWVKGMLGPKGIAAFQAPKGFDPVKTKDWMNLLQKNMRTKTMLDAGRKYSPMEEVARLKRIRALMDKDPVKATKLMRELD